MNEKVVRQLLDLRRHTAVNRIHKALRRLGRELTVELPAAWYRAVPVVDPGDGYAPKACSITRFRQSGSSRK